MGCFHVGVKAEGPFVDNFNSELQLFLFRLLSPLHYLQQDAVVVVVVVVVEVIV